MPYPKTEQIRKERRAAAEKRQAAYAALPTEEKLARASAKELKKILAKAKTPALQKKAKQ